MTVRASISGWVDPNVAKARGLQSQGAKGASAVALMREDPGNAGPEILRVSSGEKRWPMIDPIIKFNMGLFIEVVSKPPLEPKLSVGLQI
jgi:hypothetical protein